MSISIRSEGDDLFVAINRWGEAETKAVRIEGKGKPKVWDRSDRRGFIARLPYERNGPRYFYVTVGEYHALRGSSSLYQGSKKVKEFYPEFGKGGAEGVIKVRNRSKHPIKVSVSKWGPRGKTRSFPLDSGESDEWSRGSEPNVMVIDMFYEVHIVAVREKYELEVTDSYETKSGKYIGINVCRMDGGAGNLALLKWRRK